MAPPTLNELRSATRRRRCPLCYSGLAVARVRDGYALRCNQGHEMTDLKECPLDSTLAVLEREAQAATAHLRVGQESVAKSMADLFS